MLRWSLRWLSVCLGLSNLSWLTSFRLKAQRGPKACAGGRLHRLTLVTSATCVTGGVTRVSRLSGVARATGVTRVTSITRVTGVTGVTGGTGVTDVTDVTGAIGVTDPDYPEKKNQRLLYAKKKVKMQKYAKYSSNSNLSVHFLLPCGPRQFCACTAGHPVQNDSKLPAKPTNPTDLATHLFATLIDIPYGERTGAFLLKATMVELLIASRGIHHPPEIWHSIIATKNNRKWIWGRMQDLDSRYSIFVEYVYCMYKK